MSKKDKKAKRPQLHTNRKNLQSVDIEQDFELSLVVKLDDRLLTKAELSRIPFKVDLVTKSAKRLMAGMLKGTMKYAPGPLDEAAWAEHEYDELMDSVNYRELGLAAKEGRHDVLPSKEETYIPGPKAQNDINPLNH